MLKDTLGSTERCCEEFLYIQKKWEEMNRKKKIAMGFNPTTILIDILSNHEMYCIAFHIHSELMSLSWRALNRFSSCQISFFPVRKIFCIMSVD